MVVGTFTYGRDIHVWELLMCGGGIHMWELLTCGGGIHVWELLTCGGGIHVWELLTCGGDIHVWELLTCGTSHQSEILHSLIFTYNLQEVNERQKRGAGKSQINKYLLLVSPAIRVKKNFPVYSLFRFLSSRWKRKLFSGEDDAFTRRGDCRRSCLHH